MSMTLEQAIRILHPDTSLDTLNTVLVASSYSHESVLEAENEAILLACEVMQREVERGKGCDGCREKGLWEDELEYGYNSPCTRCNRRAPDNYNPLNDGKVDGDE